MSVTMIDMLNLSKDWVDGLEGYRKETAILVRDVLAQNITAQQVALPELYEEVTLRTNDQHREQDATKMIRMLFNTLNVSDEQKRYEARILEEALATRGPLKNCFVSPKNELD